MRQIALCLAALFLFSSPLFSQDGSTGSIRGSVLDPAGRRISGATIALANTATGFHYEQATDIAGRFAFQLLPPGDYSARVSAEKMSPQLSPFLRVTLGGVTEIEFKLQIAGATENVTVSAEPRGIETQPRGLTAVIDERAILNMPLNGRRFTDLALLTSQATPDPRGLNSSSNGDLSFGGVRGFQTTYLVDGGDNNNAFFAQARGRYRAPYQFSNEVIQEFRVSPNSNSPESGRTAGTVVNVVTKSGTNKFHGTGFYYLRDSVFDASDPELQMKPSDTQQQFGLTLGGPLKRNRVFFFGGYDQHIFHEPTVVRFANGANTVFPQAAAGPATPGDYEADDQALVFATAAKLDQQAGLFPSKLVGNAGFAKLDVTISAHNQLALRVNTSRYSGTNNVFLDPSSPLTTYAISDNGIENVETETASAALTTGLSFRTVSHFRAQYSFDHQWSETNSGLPLTRIPTILDGMGRSTILPRENREHRAHAAETISREGSRHSWKFGGDALLTKIYDFFPSTFGGEYIFDPIRVNPFTFEPMIGGLELTPLRAYAHQVPHYYIQDFGSAVSHPDTNEYAGFAQDMMRVTDHFDISLGVRYDLQAFATKYLKTNPLWPDSGKVPLSTKDFAPRIGLSYALGNDRPLVARISYGLFYPRIPQIYNSTIERDNGLTPNSIFLNQTNFYAQQIFPQYPFPVVNCAPLASACSVPANLLQFAESDISAFAHNFRSPEVHQASLSLEREMGRRVVGEISYSFVRGQDLIRARDVNLPPPTNVQYPIYDSSGASLLGYGAVESFATWQLSDSLACPFPPCINPLARPIPQLGSIKVFESAASSVYHGATISIRRQMTHGLYFRIGYTYAHAMDDGQDALVAGRPATVENSYSPNSERANSVTDQRNRFVLSWIYEPRALNGGRGLLGVLTKGWKNSGVVTAGSGMPVDATVSTDANQDGNYGNDRLPGARRNSFVGPNYASTNMRVARRLYAHNGVKVELTAESFNLLNRLNSRFQLTDDGAMSNAASFNYGTKQIGINHFPAYYQVPTNFMKATNAYAPRQMQFALRFSF
ncbi:MAG TPA: TonB-dependent receptor [Terriglobales bacterium]|nr:TonB-dependent receptor [Terriglobales bacterium]